MQAEWCLLFKYILQFPSLIDEIASFLNDGAFRIVAKVNKVYISARFDTVLSMF